jgi:hypothetical protein
MSLNPSPVVAAVRPVRACCALGWIMLVSFLSVTPAARRDAADSGGSSLAACQVLRESGKMMLLGWALGKRHPATFIPPSPHVAVCRSKPKVKSGLPLTCRGRSRLPVSQHHLAVGTVNSRSTMAGASMCSAGAPTGQPFPAQWEKL